MAELKDKDDQMGYLKRLLESQEELCDELAEYLEEDGPLGPCIRHPLVYSIIHSPMHNGLVNEQFKAKTEAVARAVKDQKWSSYLYLHERPYRLDAFEAIESELDDATYWKLLGGIWTDTENMWAGKDLWRWCLQDRDADMRHLMMSDEERRALAEDHGDVIRVYRGYTDSGDPDGFSWTTNSIVGKFFARRLARPNQRQYLATGLVDKANVIAFFDGRSEQEIVCLPEDVMEIQVTEVKL